MKNRGNGGFLSDDCHLNISPPEFLHFQNNGTGIPDADGCSGVLRLYIGTVS